jgi:hypothetical protein
MTTTHVRVLFHQLICAADDMITVVTAERLASELGISDFDVSAYDNPTRS